jgi:PIN domain nuclease of toxin-antitoxin system
MLPDPTTIVLDTSALLAYLADEPGADLVQTVLGAAARRQVHAVCPTLCIAEALVVAAPGLGSERIDDFRAAIEQLPVVPVSMDFATAIDAAMARLAWGLEFPEAAAAIAAQRTGAILLTTNPQFAAFERSGGRVYWIGPEQHRNEPTLFDPLARFAPPAT